MFDPRTADIDTDLAAAISALSATAGTEVTGADEQALCDTALALEAARRFLDAAEGHVLAELEARGVTDRSFGLKTVQWLAREAGLPSHVAKARVITAAKLRRVLPDVDAALTAGRVGFDHARVLADAANPRIEDAIAAAATDLCDAADGWVFEKWAREVRGFAEQLDTDGGHDPAGDVARNRLRFSRLGANAVLNGELVGEHALISDHVLNHVADQLFKQYVSDHEVCPEIEVPDRATLLALAFAEICRRAQATDVGSSKPPSADAALLIDANDLDSVSDEHGTHLPDFAHRCLSCDPTLFAMVINSLGVPLDMGRELRFANRFPDAATHPPGATHTTAANGSSAAEPTSTNSSPCAATTTASTTTPKCQHQRGHRSGEFAAAVPCSARTGDTGLVNLACREAALSLRRQGRRPG